jgi:hypothetical protein
MRAFIGKAKEAWGRFGPYVLLEAVMPGGTLLALGLYLYRQRRAGCVPLTRTNAAMLPKTRLRTNSAPEHTRWSRP